MLNTKEYYTIAYLCPKMTHFDAVDFSECHSKEGISFFWRSVYYINVVSVVE